MLFTNHNRPFQMVCKSLPGAFRDIPWHGDWALLHTRAKKRKWQYFFEMACLMRSSRPMTGSSLPFLAASVRSRAYLDSASYLLSGSCTCRACALVTPCMLKRKPKACSLSSALCRYSEQRAQEKSQPRLLHVPLRAFVVTPLCLTGKPRHAVCRVPFVIVLSTGLKRSQPGHVHRPSSCDMTL